MGKSFLEAPPSSTCVRIAKLPDVIPVKAKHPPQEARTEAPWWASADVELVPTPAEAPVFAELVLDEPRFVAPAGRWAIDVPLVTGSIATALLVVGTVVFAAWHLTQRAPAATPQAVAEAPAPKFIEVPAPVVEPAPVEAAPVEEAPKLDPQIEARLAEMDRLKEVVAKFERRTQELEKEAVARSQQAALAQAKAAEPKGCYGTSVNFAVGPTEAAEEALKDKKLLMILTISGNFEEAKFT